MRELPFRGTPLSFQCKLPHIAGQEVQYLRFPALESFGLEQYSTATANIISSIEFIAAYRIALQTARR
ncbi:Uncharacterized protein HZ326_23681, partial [Fusarium oxysporum f. sp. albedinis]